MEDDPVLDMISTLVRGGKTPQDAARTMKASGVSEGAADRALEQLLAMARANRGQDEPGAIDADDLEDWYPGPGPDDHFWPGLKKSLREKGWGDAVVQSVDHQSTRVVARLASPGREEFDTRGLVLGYVQSGKTANFTAVMAKAADAGYRLFIVLSGLTNLLRTQTQIRLDNDLVQPTRDRWVWLTTEVDDFRAGNLQNINAYLADHTTQRVICVIKKNATVLRRLLAWLRAASNPILQQAPVLIIDDEADQASVNTGRPEDDRSAINRLILNTLSRLPKSSYVGYTATPFANVLIDPAPEDLYPKDFILSLPKSDNYFGPEVIFGRQRLRPDEPEQDGLDMIRRVTEDEISSLQPLSRDERDEFSPDLTDSLKTALQYFWLATAARRARGQESAHSTMLIHTTMYVIAHERLAEVVETYRRSFLRELMRGNTDELNDRLRQLWQDEQRRVPPELMGEEQTAFDAVRGHLLAVVAQCQVVVENAASAQRLDYSRPATQIVVGGNVLSRGLTLEGLIVSYFIRTASAYDTLLQMGRWFGYRKGYSDLPRVWMTEELERYFYDLATVEQEIRNDIRRYEIERITPLDFGPRIRMHPAMSITSRMKMQAAIPANVSYSDRRLQTILFNHRDEAWLRQNLNAASDLVRKALQFDEDRKYSGNTLILRRIPARLIAGFLDRYRFHDESVDLKTDLLQKYIREQNEQDELLEWNIGVVGKQVGPETPVLNLADAIEVPLLTRSKLRAGSEQYANLGAIMSKEDRVIDLGLDIADVRKMDEGELQARRPRGVGLLLLYPIDKDSTPPREGLSSRRVPLNAAEHVIGVALVFPRAETTTAIPYVTVDLSSVRREEMEFMDEEDTDS